MGTSWDKQFWTEQELEQVRRSKRAERIMFFATAIIFLFACYIAGRGGF